MPTTFDRRTILKGIAAASTGMGAFHPLALSAKPISAVRKSKPLNVVPNWLPDEASLPVVQIDVATMRVQSPVATASRGMIVEIPPGDHSSRRLHFSIKEGWFQPDSLLVLRCSKGRAKVNLIQGGKKQVRTWSTQKRCGVKLQGIDVQMVKGQSGISIWPMDYIEIIQFDIFYGGSQGSRNGMLIPSNPGTVLKISDGTIHHCGGSGLYHGIYTNNLSDVLVENVKIYSLGAGGKNHGSHCLKLYGNRVQVFNCTLDPSKDETGTAYPNWGSTFAPLDISGYGQTTIVGNTIIRGAAEARDEIASWRNRVFPGNKWGAGQMPELSDRPYRHLFAFNTVVNSSSKQSRWALWNDGVWPGQTQGAPTDWATIYADWSNQDSVVYHYGNDWQGNAFKSLVNTQPYQDPDPAHVAPITELRALPDWARDRLTG